MRTKIIIAALVIFSMFAAERQAAAQTWSTATSPDRLYVNPSTTNVGIGSSSPTNRLEIQGDTLDTLGTGIHIDNISGLDRDVLIRFQLGGTSIFTMGVDDSDADKFKIGTTALETNTRLTIDANGNVGIGTTTPSSAFSVGASGNSLWKGYFYNSSTSNNTVGLRAETAAPTGSNWGYAASGGVTCGAGFAVGVIGTSYNGSTSGGRAYGVYGQGGNASTGYNYGVYGILSGSNNGAGVFATVSGDASVPGQYALYVNGDIRTTDATPEKPTDAFWTVIPSDGRFKTNIQDFQDGLQVLRKIRPVNYNYNGIGGLSTEENIIGIIAQEVQKAAPYCVGKSRIIVNASEKSAFAENIVGTLRTDSTEEKYIAEVLNYNPNGLFYAMINSIKELDSTVTALNKKIEALEETRGTTAPQSNDGLTPAATRIHLVNESKETVLYQNIPNPFSNETTINYYVPETVKEARMVFYDNTGIVINEMELQQKGKGALTIDSSRLSNGAYSYSIIVDGKVVDTKKMMKSK